MSQHQKPQICRLCHHKAFWFCSYFKNSIDFFRCTNCRSIFKEEAVFLGISAEKARYETHNNDVDDVRYQQFVSPITTSILNDFSNKAIGLDYGCGTGPVISHLLKQKGFHVILYDPFFYPDQTYKTGQYQFIICCEVMEHFHQPAEEFQHLRKLLTDKGKLYCKTSLISDDIGADEFQAWHYKNDPTHVFFYTPSALSYIKSKEGFQSVLFDDKLIIFST